MPSVFAALLAGMLLLLAACGLPQTPQQRLAVTHATTVYLLDGTLGKPGLAPYLSTNLPAIKAAGFNAVYIPAVWADFDPSPIVSPRSYNAAGFADAKAALTVIRSAGMRAVTGLNYVGPGFAPDFGAVLPDAQACDWARTPVVYAAFEQYVAEFMSEMAADSDILSLMVFTESAEGCGQATQAAAPTVALQLQKTLGSLPSRMPPLLRFTWNIGYHDYTIVNLGWGNGVGPIAMPNPFDFVSMVAYNVGTTAELDARSARFAALYPGVPLFVGEMGVNGCSAPPGVGEAGQATGDAILAQWALAKGHGFSVWGWPASGGASDETLECSNPVFGGLAITNADGTPRAAVAAIKAVLGP